MIIRKSRSEIEKMRAAGQIVAQTLSKLRKMVEPGITTKELDAAAESHIRKSGAILLLKDIEVFQLRFVHQLMTRSYTEFLQVVN